MSDSSKKIKRQLREYLTEAYERELHRELTKLDQSFAEWRASKISSGELSYRIHQYETGPSRQLYQQYNSGEVEMTVAYAIVTGLLARDEISADVLATLERHLSFYQALKAEGSLKEPGT
ncbi:MAG: hypothetical protein HZB51_00835 [Chloroflexi bacterium]|nr:hypothetical protein [Chloroflexota bacterium]